MMGCVSHLSGLGGLHRYTHRLGVVFVAFCFSEVQIDGEYMTWLWYIYIYIYILTPGFCIYV